MNTIKQLEDDCEGIYDSRIGSDDENSDMELDENEKMIIRDAC